MKQNRRNFLKATVGLSAIATLAPATVVGQELFAKLPLAKGKHVFLTKPYLQNPSENSMTIMWVVNLPSYSFVEYGETENLGLVARSVEGGLVVANNRINNISLHGLKPGAKYFYRVIFINSFLHPFI